MFSISRKNFKMADENAWEPLVETLTKSFSNLSPQILPGMHGAKKVVSLVQNLLQRGLHTFRFKCEIVNSRFCYN